MICDAARNFERLETQLYLDWAGPQEFLKVSSHYSLGFSSKLEKLENNRMHLSLVAGYSL